MPLCPPLCRRVSCLPLAVVSFSLFLSPCLSNAETCPEAVSDRSKQGAWTCTFDLNSRAVHLMLLKGTESHSQVFWFPEDFNGTKAWFWHYEPGDTTLDLAELDSLVSNENLFCSGHSALPDGRPFITGGTDFGNEYGLDSLNTIDLATRQWDPVSERMAVPRWYPTNTTLGDGRVLISAGQKYGEFVTFGGDDGTGEVADSWSIGGIMSLPWLPIDLTGSEPGTRKYHTMADLFGHVGIGGCSQTQNHYLALLYGGIRGTTLLSDLWGLKWNVRTNEYTWDALSVTDPPGGLYRHTAIFDPFENSMLIFGGKTSTGVSGTVYRLRNIGTGTDCTSPNLVWDTVSASGGPEPRYGHGAVYDTTGKRMIIFGGRNDDNPPEYFNDVWTLSDLGGTPTWTELTPLGSEGQPSPRAGAVTVLDPTCVNPSCSNQRDRLVVMGGFRGEDSDTLSSDVLWFGKMTDTTVTWDAVVRCESDTACSSTNVFPCINQGTIQPFADAAGVFQPLYQRVVVYGGVTSTGAISDTLRALDLELTTCGYLVWRTWDTASDAGARSGHGLVFDGRPRTALKPEIFDPVTEDVSYVTATAADRWLYSYPFMYLLPDGDVFYAGPDNTAAKFDFTSGWSTGANFESGNFFGDTSVMFQLGETTRVMKCGQKTNNPTDALQRSVGVIDIIAGTVGSWSVVSSGSQALSETHQDANITILPTGRALLTGGTAQDFDPDNDATFRLTPHMWDPTSKEWDEDLENEFPQIFYAKEPVARDYHSVAMLLPDGSVLSAGGEVEGSDPGRRMTAAIYRPPYLFKPNGDPVIQPTLSCLDSRITHGQRFHAILSDTTTITSLSLIRPSSVTHGFNQEQRFLQLDVDSSYVVGSNRHLFASSPDSANLAPVGNYLLFAMTQDGTPSIASWVTLVPGVSKSGTVSGTETWTSANDYYIGEELVVTGSLTINSGTVVRMAGDATIVLDGGTLEATGVTFEGSDGCGWTGIHVKNGTVTLDTCQVSDADIGVFFVDGTGGGSITGCQFSNNTSGGVWVNNSATVTLDGNTFTCPSVSNHVAVHVDTLGTNTSVSNSTIYGASASGVIGILCECDASIALVGNQIFNFNGTNGRGIEFSLRDSSYVPTVTNSSSPDTSHTIIKNCTDGIFVNYFSRPKLRGIRIDECVYAIRVNSAAYADVGKASYDQGGCDITDSSNKHVNAKTRVSGMPDVDALYNYWGFCSPAPGCSCSTSSISAKMTAHVNWDPYLTCDPFNTLSIDVEVAVVQPPRLFGSYPNPFQSEASIAFRASEAGGLLEIKIYDVSGRLVRGMSFEDVPAGDGVVRWDGRDDGGRSVSSGLYYYRVRIGKTFSAASKMLLIRR